jgi:hypothetical protein
MADARQMSKRKKKVRRANKQLSRVGKKVVPKERSPSKWGT